MKYRKNRMDLGRIVRPVVVIAVLSVTLAGCVATGVNQKASHESYIKDGYEGISSSYLDKNGELDIEGDDLETLLIGGKALHDAGYWQQSATAFELAEARFVWKADTVDTPEEVGKLVGTTLTNDRLASYSGKIFEGVMLDYYQAMNYLMLGDDAKTRVRFNRLKERQSNAETQLRKYTESLSRSDQSTDNSPKPNEQQKKIIALVEKKSGGALKQGATALPTGVKSNEIRNPAGDLLGALFRGTSTSRSDKQGNQIEDMINAASSKGFNAEARALASILGTELKRQDQDHIYVLYEDGQGPSLDEFRVDLPLFLVSKDVLYSGIALPEFKPGVSAQATVTVTAGKTSTQLVTVTDMNRIASLEFDANYDGKVAKAVSSSVLKTIAQAAINREIEKKNEGNPLALLLMKTAVAAGQAALTSADTRAWFNLPNSIRLGVMKHESENSLRFTNQSGEQIAQVYLPKGNGDLLVYARQAMTGGEIKIYVQRLPANMQAASL